MTTYSVFVRFRERRRLALCRRIPSLDAAIECAHNHRRARFHDPDAVFVVADETGEPVDEEQVRAAQLAAVVPAPRRVGPGLVDTSPRAYSACIRDARRHLAEALTELPSAHGSVALARTAAALDILVAAEHELERYERLVQLDKDGD